MKFLLWISTWFFILSFFPRSFPQVLQDQPFSFGVSSFCSNNSFFSPNLTFVLHIINSVHCIAKPFFVVGCLESLNPLGAIARGPSDIREVRSLPQGFKRLEDITLELSWSWWDAAITEWICNVLVFKLEGPVIFVLHCNTLPDHLRLRFLVTEPLFKSPQDQNTSKVGVAFGGGGVAAREILSQVVPFSKSGSSSSGCSRSGCSGSMASFLELSHSPRQIVSLCDRSFSLKNHVSLD